MSEAQNPETEDQFIAIDDFLKVELRVGEIKVAERIPKADKLLRFEIDLGEEKPRQISRRTRRILRAGKISSGAK